MSIPSKVLATMTIIGIFQMVRASLDKRGSGRGGGGTGMFGVTQSIEGRGERSDG